MRDTEHFKQEALWMALLPASILVVALVAGGVGVLVTQMRAARELSAQQALFSELCEQLRVALRETNRTPNTITDLRPGLSWPDGSSPELLASYSIRATNTGRAVVWSSPEGPRSCEVGIATR